MIATIPIVLGVVAYVLFNAQGGFGGGHGNFDRAIAILGLPSTIVTTLGPVGSDLATFVILPAVLNAVLWYVVAYTVLRTRARTPRPN